MIISSIIITAMISVIKFPNAKSIKYNVKISTQLIKSYNRCDEILKEISLFLSAIYKAESFCKYAVFL